MDAKHDTSNWPRARMVAALLREEFAALGFTEDEIRQIVPTADIEGREQVRLGTVSIDSADRILAKLYSLRVVEARS